MLKISIKYENTKYKTTPNINANIFICMIIKIKSSRVLEVELLALALYTSLGWWHLDFI